MFIHVFIQFFILHFYDLMSECQAMHWLLDETVVVVVFFLFTCVKKSHQMKICSNLQCIIITLLHI